jgi:hypothetical protein
VRAWDGDWRARLLSRLRTAGFSSATAYAEAYPTRTLVELAHQLGDGDVAGVQIEWLMKEDAEADPVQFVRFASSLLVREIWESMPEGWGENAQLARVYGSWSAALGDPYDAHRDRVFDWLMENAPAGWRPTGPDDPLLAEAFKLWPGEKSE